MKPTIPTIDIPFPAIAVGGPELLILLVLLAIPVGIAVVAVVIVLSTRSKSPAPVAPIPKPADERIRELNALLENKLITAEEHEQRRNEILNTV